MKNKKGLLPKATLRMVIAVICILFLVSFLVSLYYSYSRNKDLEQAEASLEHLIEQINSQSTGMRDVEIYNPQGWGITSYGEGEKIPDFCLNLGWKNCVCICGPLGGGSFGTAKMACLAVDEKGIVCRENDYSVFFGSINIEPPLTLTIDYETKTISKISKKET